MNLQPLEDRIVVRPAEAEETTVSGLVIPDTAKEKPQQGEVLAVGPGRRAENSGELIPLDLAAGDTVVYSKYGGTEITVDGEDLLILSSRDVLAKVAERQEVRSSSSTGAPRHAGVARGTAARPSLGASAQCRPRRGRSSAGAARGGLLRPLVVGLAVRAAHDLRDEHEVARALERATAPRARPPISSPVAAVPGGRRHDRGHRLAEAVVGHADDEAVDDGGVELHRLLDLFGEDLLAAAC